MLSKKEQKFIKSLKIKKYRLREKRFLVEGTKNVLELLDSDFQTDLIVGSENFIVQHPKIRAARIETAKPDLLAQLGTFKTNDSVIAVAQMKEEVSLPNQLVDHLFVLDGVGDPGNLGTIIRTLDWFGFRKLVCSPDCAEFYHPKVIAGTMGSFTRIAVHTMDLQELFTTVSVPILAADMQGENIADLKLDQPCLVVMGSESNGISPKVMEHISKKITIPRYGAAESLNVGIAAGIIAFHLRIS